ncbi:hypothetical protein QQX10_11110 [Demequina sp. SYSU T00039]|uniref:Uncharacterized protein n=1 Tax=Demequina lignilytica TaxID=3051663 RepID=A0AAW7M9I9_9MICO|nr:MULTISPECIES: hypothetical protein [unclassified Demequina]MDN4478738.1 hypothetical protein [Demequina sp. SYSU T00039-1]MDN4488715.1 hypothetical protein [Demequina sp. SYSU T00039]
MARKQVAAVVAVIAALVLGTLLTACASPETGGGVEYDETLDLGVPGDALQLETGVLYYPACGNEVLTWDGAPWYPYRPANVDELPADPIGAFHAAAMAEPVAFVPAVVAPGPGDDRGTLVIFEGALAYWESDSGDLSTWLTRTELENWWAC